MSYDIEAPGTEEVSIEHRGKTAKYIVREITEPEMRQIFPLGKDGKPDPSKSQDVSSKLIALAVTRTDGGEITQKQADGFPMGLKMKLSKAVMAFNALGEDAEAEAGEG